MGGRWPRLVAVAVLAALVTGGGRGAAGGSPSPAGEPATSPAAAPPRTFFDRVDVELVELEVWVREDGEPVRGLTAGDFEVLEDGRPVVVSHLAATEPAAGSPAGTPEERPVAEAAAPASEERTGLLLSFFVDRRSLPPHAGRRYAPGLRELVERSLRPGDLAMVVAFDREVETMLAPSADLRALLAALDRALTPSSRAIQATAARRRILNELARIPAGASDAPARGGGSAAFDGAMRDALASDIAVWAHEREADTRATLGGMIRHVTTLAGVPGRRAVLYLGEGMQTRFAEPLVQAWKDKFVPPGRTGTLAGEGRLPSTTDRSLEQDIGEAAAVANTCGVTISALSGGYGLEGGSASVESVGPEENLGAADVFDQRDALVRLAEPTGGTVGFKLSDAVIDRLAGDLRPDYVLGYSSPAGGSGRRRIDVRLRPEALAGRRVELRHRTGRQARDADTRMRDRIAAGLLWDLGENPLGVVVAPGDGVREGDGVRLGLDVRFPLSAIVLLPSEGAHEGRLTIYLAARDARGRSSPVLRKELVLRIPAAQLAALGGQMAQWQTEITLRRESHQLIVGVRDEIGGTESIATSSWSPGGGPRRGGS